MKVFRYLYKSILLFLSVPLVYLAVSLLLTYIPVNTDTVNQEKTNTIYLSTNGVHLYILIPSADLDPKIAAILPFDTQQKSYISFGWGDKNFFLNTPTWQDLTLKNATIALFLKSNSLLHTSQYMSRRSSWKPVAISSVSLAKMNAYILTSFQKDTHGQYSLIHNANYPRDEFFFKANGVYSLFNTSNTWVNSGFKESNLKACLWTPFDFGLISKYE